MTGSHDWCICYRVIPIVGDTGHRWNLLSLSLGIFSPSAYFVLSLDVLVECNVYA